jgi:hypothetical protein
LTTSGSCVLSLELVVPRTNLQTSSKYGTATKQAQVKGFRTITVHGVQRQPYVAAAAKGQALAKHSCWHSMP